MSQLHYVVYDPKLQVAEAWAGLQLLAYLQGTACGYINATLFCPRTTGA